MCSRSPRCKIRRRGISVATLTQNFKRGQDTKGRLTLAVEGVADGKLQTLDWAALTQGRIIAGIEYGFKYFQQVNGTIMLPAGFQANRVRVRADGDGGRVEQDFAWKRRDQGSRRETMFGNDKRNGNGVAVRPSRP